MTPEAIRALVDRYQNMTRKQALKFARANLKLAGQGNKGIGLMNTKNDPTLGEDGISRITVSVDQQAPTKAYLMIEVAPDPSTELNVDLERKSSPMLVVSVATRYRPSICIRKMSVMSAIRISSSSACTLMVRVNG